MSCALSKQLRKQVARLLPAQTLRIFLADFGNAPDEAFALSLLLANLSDLALPPDAAAAAAKAEVDDPLGLPVEIFGDVARPVWYRAGFFSSLAACLAAALRGEQWPPGSGLYHAPWKLAGSCVRLAAAGYADELRSAVAPLIATVERRAAHEEVSGADEARAARLAAAALHALQENAAALAEMREAPGLTDALRLTEAEEPWGRDLLAVLADDTAAGSAGEG